MQPQNPFCLVSIAFSLQVISHSSSLPSSITGESQFYSNKIKFPLPLGCPIFASYFFFASKRNDAKQKPFRFLFALFRETINGFFASFRFVSLQFFRIVSLQFFRIVSLQFLSIGFFASFHVGLFAS